MRKGRRVGWGGALSGMQPPTHSCPQLAPTALPILSRSAPRRIGTSLLGAMPYLRDHLAPEVPHQRTQQVAAEVPGVGD